MILTAIALIDVVDQFTRLLRLADARHINIAHGIYPRDTMSDSIVDALAEFLSKSVTQAEGRTYAGGLTKFEPKEVERLLVPEPSILMQLPLLLDFASA